MTLLDQMRDFFLLLFSGSGYMPRTQCGTWTPVLLRSYVTADLIIAAAYFAIPLCILWAYKRFGRSAPLPIEARIVCALFATFIVTCGCSHLVDAMIFIHPVYRLQTLVLSVTALCSVLAATVMPRLIQKIGVAQQTIKDQEQSIEQYRADVDALKGQIREMRSVVDGYIKSHPDSSGSTSDGSGAVSASAGAAGAIGATTVVIADAAAATGEAK